MSGNKLDQGKPRLDLIPTEFNIGVGKALGYGAKKYGEDNFRKGIGYRRLLGAALRHIELELSGVPLDDESGLEHWMNASASLAMYAFMKKNHPNLDDRYKYTEEQLKELVKQMYGE